MYAQVHYNCERETCSLCSKFIYKHQPVVVCSMDGNIYHGNCLGFVKIHVSIFSRVQFLIGFAQLVLGKFSRVTSPSLYLTLLIPSLFSRIFSIAHCASLTCLRSSYF